MNTKGRKFLPWSYSEIFRSKISIWMKCQIMFDDFFLRQIVIVYYPLQLFFRLVAHLNYHVKATIANGYSCRKPGRKEFMMHAKLPSPNLSILNPLINMTGQTRPSGNISTIFLYQISINYYIVMYQKLVAPTGNGYF